MVSSKKIVLLNSFVSTLEPLILRLVEWGYEPLPLRNNYDLDAWKNPEEELLGILDLTVDLTLERNRMALQQHLQNVKTKGPQLTLLGIFAGKMKFSWHQVYQLGVGGVFQFPLDEELFFNRLFELCPSSVDVKKLGLDALVKVNVTSLEREIPLAYDVFVYLAANQRVILLRKGGQLMEESTRQKFQQNNQWSLYIRRSDLALYQEDLGKNLFQNESDQNVSRGNLQKSMQGFFSETEFSSEEAAQMIQNLKSALDSQMMAKPSHKGLWMEGKKVVSQKLTFLGHSQNVAAYCALFGQVLGYPKIEDLALAGALHDVGLGELPPELLWKVEKNRTPEENAQYRLHPGFAKHTLEKTLRLSKPIVEAILYHHERMDGSGYPYGLKGDQIPLAAKILALADEFDQRTSIRPGYPQWTPREAMIQLAGLEGASQDPVFDAEFFKPIIELFYESPKLDHSLTKKDLKEDSITSGMSLRSLLAKTPIPLKDRPLGPMTPGSAIESLHQQLEQHFKKV